MLQRLTECESCGADEENLAWKEIEWNYVEASETIQTDETYTGKATLCTVCGHTHGISTGFE